jgi:hypothetical protein
MKFYSNWFLKKIVFYNLYKLKLCMIRLFVRQSEMEIEKREEEDILVILLRYAKLLMSRPVKYYLNSNKVVF